MWPRGVRPILTATVLLVGGALAFATPSAAGGGGHKIKMYDDCEPTSFNAALGPGACLSDGHGHHHGDTTFPAFLAELQATQEAADWEFKPSMLTIRAGRPVILENRGGETHTFTMVKKFGGGFVDVLNDLSDNPVPAGECASTLPDGSLVPKPPSAKNVFVDADRQAAFRTARLKPGRYLFECCIHPWMRVIVRVR